MPPRCGRSAAKLPKLGEGSETKDTATCLCGCGSPVNTKRGRRYVWGHHMRHRRPIGEKNPAFGKAPWNKGKTKATDSTVAAYAEKLATSCLGRVPHNKGRTKIDYEPLRRVSDKCAGNLNGMAGKIPWNVGLRKLTNPDRVVYGKPRESHWNWRGGIQEHGPDFRGYDWLIARLAALARDGHACRHCGATSSLVVHHIRAYRDFRDNQLSNLITLCRRCHGRLEASIRLGRVDDIVRTVQRCTEVAGNERPATDEVVIK